MNDEHCRTGSWCTGCSTLNACLIMSVCKWLGHAHLLGQEVSMANTIAEAKSRSASKKARRRQQKAKPSASAVLAGPFESAECGEGSLQKNSWPGASLQRCHPWMCSRRHLRQLVTDGPWNCRFWSCCTARVAAVQDHQGAFLPDNAIIYRYIVRHR